MERFFALLSILIASSSTALSQRDCPAGKIFTECGTACPRTCENYMLDFACTAECVEGCFCPPELVEHDGGCVSVQDCPAAETTPPPSPSPSGPNCELDNGGCRVDQICTVMGMGGSPGTSYVSCKNPPYVPCGSDAFLACDSEFTYCLQQNKTRRPSCVASCLSNNGGCLKEEVCVTSVGEDSTTSLQCQSVDDISSECPAGQLMNPCGAYCQETCEQRVSGEEFACIELCGPPACACPRGLVLFRDRCVDPRLCFVLLNYPPAINPLPIVRPNQYLYSMFSPNSGISDFLEPRFLEAVSQVLNSRGYPYVDVDLHGIYEDGSAGLQIVVRLSGDDVTEDTSVELTTILQDNADELPLPVDQVSLVDADRVCSGKSFWTVWRIAIVSGVGMLSLLILAAAFIAALAVCCSNSTRTKDNSEKLNVEIYQLLEDDDLKEEEEREKMEESEVLS